MGWLSKNKYMRSLAVLYLLVGTLAFGCGGGRGPNETVASAQSKAVEVQGTTDNANAQPAKREPPKQDFDKALPKQIREALENADDFEILSLDSDPDSPRLTETFTVDNHFIFGNKLKQVSDAQLKDRLLKAFYEDVKTGGWVNACFAPHHTLKVRYKQDYLLIAICFHCGHYAGTVSKKSFQAKPYLTFRGSIPHMEDSASLSLFDEIVAAETK